MKNITILIIVDFITLKGEMMDIETIKTAKQQCESEIRAIIVMFEHQTDLVIEQINLNRKFQTINCPSELDIELDVRLK